MHVDDTLEVADGDAVGRGAQRVVGEGGHALVGERLEADLGAVGEAGLVVAALERQHQAAVGEAHQLLGHVAEAGRRELVAAQLGRVALGAVEAARDEHDLRLEGLADRHHHAPVQVGEEKRVLEEGIGKTMGTGKFFFLLDLLFFFFESKSPCEYSIR